MDNKIRYMKKEDLELIAKHPLTCGLYPEKEEDRKTYDKILEEIKKR